MTLVYLLAFCRIAIGLTFALSFVAKVKGVSQFVETIDNFDLLPRQFTRIAAVLFLSGEATVVLLLIFGGQFLAPAFALASLLLLLFSLALLSALRRNIKTPCNCFGTGEKPISYYDVWRNAAFIGINLLGLWLIPQVQEGPASQNWLALIWERLTAIGGGNSLQTLLVVNAILTWLILLPTFLFMLLLAKRFRQLGKRSPKEQLLKEAGSRRGQPAPPFEAQDSVLTG